jgi:CHAT domain-containing protein
VFVHRGLLGAVSVVDGSVRLHRLAPVSTVAKEVDALHFALRRQACGTRRAVRGAVRHSAELAASALDEVLISGLGRRIGERPLVIVPAGPLHAVPWAVLPSCRGRAVSVAPSVRCWLRAARVGGAAAAGNAVHGVSSVWVAGPGLGHAEREVRALQESAGGRLLLGDEASVDGVLTALEGTQIAHIASHGHFRADQPLFSHVELADGPLYGYDLERLRCAPRLVVLSACEAGLSSMPAGAEMTGLAAVLLRRGTAALVASVLPVSDERTPAVMMSLHAGLRSGLGPAAALAAAQAEHGHLGFVCVGAG